MALRGPDRRKPALSRYRSHLCEEFIFAKVTTVRRVREIVLVLRFEGPQYNVPRADLIGELLSCFQFSTRQRFA